jgi:dihydroorotate dehydrogenase (NAD+) catalytic subunit
VPNAVDLSVTVGALRLSNPILAASGTFGYGVEFADLVDLNRLGGIVVKGLSLEPMAGAPAPRLCETPSGMLNAVGLQNVGVRAFVAEKLPALRQYRTAVITNVFGCTVNEYV